MKTCLIALLTFSISITCRLQAEQPSELLIPKDYAKRKAIAINGKEVVDPQLLPALMELVKHQGEDFPIAVVLPDSLRFADWHNVRGLLWKVGFNNIRCFVQSSSTGKMAELKEVGPVIDKLPGH